MPPGPGRKGAELKPDEVIGVAVAVAVGVSALIGLVCCAARRGACYHGARAMRRRINWDGEQYQDGDDKKKLTTLHNIGGLRGGGEMSVTPGASQLLNKTSSSDSNASGSPTQPYVDQKVELPAGRPRFEIDGVGRSAAVGKVEMDGADVVIFELPATPARSASLSTSSSRASTLFRYSPNPSYSLDSTSTCWTAVSTVSPVSYCADGANGGVHLLTRDGEISPLLPPRGRISLTGIVEESEESENSRRHDDEMRMDKS